MAVNLSPVGGVAGQFFDNNGNPLAGGKIFTYSAGTTTNQATYTNASGGIAHSNPIILDGAGRVPSGEIWLTDGLEYKFVIKDNVDALIGTFDNITGINSNFVNFANQQEIQTATAGQTVFTLTTMQYQPGTNSLSVFVDGVNQYGPGALYAYVETDATTVTFTAGLHVGAEVKFTTSQTNSTSYGDASQISYTAPFTGSVVTNVEDKLAQTVSVKDFGAVGNQITDDTVAIQAAINSLTGTGGVIYFPPGDYLITSTLVVSESGISLIGAGADAGRVAWGRWPSRILWGGSTSDNMIELGTASLTTVRGGVIEQLVIDGAGTATVSPLYAFTATSQYSINNVIFRNYNAPIYLGSSCVGWVFNQVQLFGSTGIGLVLEGLNHNTTFNRLIASSTGIPSTVQTVVRVGVSNRCSNINFNYCDFEAQQHTYQVDLLDCRAVNVNGGYAEPQGGTAVFRLGVTAGSACEGFTMNGFYVQGNDPTYVQNYVLDIKNASAVEIGGGNHFRNITTAVIDSNTNCPTSTFGNANYLENVGGIGNKVLFDSNAGGWRFYNSGTSTPVIVGATIAGTNTYTTQDCRWRVVDGVVYFELEITLSALNSTGALTLQTNIPYSAASLYDYPVSIGRYSGFTLAAGAVLLAEVTRSTSNINLREQVGTGSGNTTVLDTEASNTLSVKISGNYPVSPLS